MIFDKPFFFSHNHTFFHVNQSQVVDDDGDSAGVPDLEAAWEAGSVVRVDLQSGKPLVQRDG